MQIKCESHVFKQKCYITFKEKACSERISKYRSRNAVRFKLDVCRSLLPQMICLNFVSFIEDFIEKRPVIAAGVRERQEFLITNGSLPASGRASTRPSAIGRLPRKPGAVPPLARRPVPMVCPSGRRWWTAVRAHLPIRRRFGVPLIADKRCGRKHD